MPRTALKRKSFTTNMEGEVMKNFASAIAIGVGSIGPGLAIGILAAKAMEGIILDKKFRLELGRKAYEWSKNFSWDKSANQFLRIIFKTIEKEREVLFVRKLELAK